MESRKMVLMNLFVGGQQKCRHREQTCGLSRGRRGWGELREQYCSIYTTIYKDSQQETICFKNQKPQRVCTVSTRQCPFTLRPKKHQRIIFKALVQTLTKIPLLVILSQYWLKKFRELISLLQMRIKFRTIMHFK